MKILCPLSPEIYQKFENLIDNGVDEFYMGYLMDNVSFGKHLSRRSGTKSNFESIETAIEAIRKIKKYNKSVFITFNQKYYLDEHIKKIISDTERLIEENIDAVIVSDINLIIKLRENFQKLKMIASTVRVSTNSNSMKFFEDLGISKFVLSAALRINEINEIIENNKDREFEIFIKNERCPNIDGLCNLSHEVIRSKYITPCLSLKCSPGILDKSQMFNEGACGICSIYDLKNSGNVSLKISGRPRSADNINKDVLFIGNALKTIRENNKISREEYKEKMKKEFIKIYGYDCNENCYYEGRYE